MNFKPGLNDECQNVDYFVNLRGKEPLVNLVKHFWKLHKSIGQFMV